MTLIVLDIDGVLAHSETFPLRDGLDGIWRYRKQLDPRCLERLQVLVQRTGAKVLLSSTWRRYQYSRDAVEVELERLGIEMVGVTTHIDLRDPETKLFLPSRGVEIQAWLDEHPEVERYVCLDDDWFDDHPLVHISGGTHSGGLQDWHVQEALSILS